MRTGAANRLETGGNIAEKRAENRLRTRPTAAREPDRAKARDGLHIAEVAGAFLSYLPIQITRTER
jgi:hypothetical protein